jgi:hypothetical protein
LRRRPGNAIGAVLDEPTIAFAEITLSGSTELTMAIRPTAVWIGEIAIRLGTLSVAVTFVSSKAFAEVFVGRLTKYTVTKLMGAIWNKEFTNYSLNLPA